MIFNFTSPITVEIPRKTKADKRIHLGLNWYRNAQHFESNIVKQLYKDNMAGEVAGYIFKEPIKITYTFFAPDNRKSDVDNKCSVINKFFQDTLVSCGCISEDNYTVVPNVEYLFGGVDKGKGRVEIKIEELEDVLQSRCSNT